ncbi:MAG: CinA family nicotinamide mononucleotide deamidase-related protein [Gemmatimonadaceae bacterium]|nr:CinA family nicotinamide mononucleotide deamidase-related protein [Chitinophagaceae bacterium]
MHASIITIGDELLIGQVIDTNSAWLAQEMNKIGIWVKRRVAVGDLADDIWNALDQEAAHSQIILITGGLGPTADDITKPLLCKYFDGKLVVNEAVLKHVRYLFEEVFRRPPPILDRNLRQAEVPDTCEVLFNRAGTAPGMWFEKNGRIFISMPGVPNEMKTIVKDHVLERLKSHFRVPAIESRTLVTFGMGESAVAERIKEFEENLPAHIKLAYLPNYGMVRLRLTGTGNNSEIISGEMDSLFETLKLQLSDIMVTDKDEPIELAVSNLLISKGKTLSTAESCTGGFIAQLFTSHAGSSAFYKGGMVSYANQVKEDLLQVDHQTILDNGAVSEETVRQMVKGALDAFKTDFALATSGIMGPGGGTETKPVGTIWIAVGNRDKIIAQKFNFRFERKRNIDISSYNAINLLRKFVGDHG